MKTHQIVIIGGGTAGITVAAQLLKKHNALDVAIIEPSEKHFYQPAWTLVGAGTFKYEDTIRDEASLIPEGATWIKDYAEELHPEKNSLTLRSGEEVSYEYLVVAPGIKIDLTLVEGLAETMNKNGVGSNYVDPKYVWSQVQSFKKGGTALFTQPTTQIKCGGAPQKIMYLMSDYLRKKNMLKDSNVIFATPGSVIFGVKEFAITLEKVIKRYGIDVRYHHRLKKVDGDKKVAVFDRVEHDETGCVISLPSGEPRISEVEVPFDFLHLAPPQTAPDFIKRSKLVHEDGANVGWVKADKNTLQHPDFPNVFALGDVAALPTAKTGAAVRKQAPVVVDNLLRLIKGETVMNNEYTGYSSCPLVTAYGKMVLAEFGYGNERMSDPLISNFVDTTKEQWSMWMLKKYGLPFMYWNLMLRGKA